MTLVIPLLWWCTFFLFIYRSLFRCLSMSGSEGSPDTFLAMSSLSCQTWLDIQYNPSSVLGLQQCALHFDLPEIWDGEVSRRRPYQTTEPPQLSQIVAKEERFSFKFFQMSEPCHSAKETEYIQLWWNPTTTEEVADFFGWECGHTSHTPVVQRLNAL